jgi:hypothetical protein
LLERVLGIRGVTGDGCVVADPRDEEHPAVEADHLDGGARDPESGDPRLGATVRQPAEGDAHRGEEYSTDRQNQEPAADRTGVLAVRARM